MTERVDLDCGDVSVDHEIVYWISAYMMGRYGVFASISRTALWVRLAIALGLLVVGGFTVGRLAMAHADGHQGTPATGPAGQDVPELAQYNQIPLPTSAPPAGALVVTAGWADPRTQGQSISFQYNGFTIGVCAVTPTTTAADACAMQPGQRIFRNERMDGTHVLFSTYSKLDPADLPAEQSSILQFFKSADLVVRPDWVPAYAAAHQ